MKQESNEVFQQNSESKKKMKPTYKKEASFKEKELCGTKMTMQEGWNVDTIKWPPGTTENQKKKIHHHHPILPPGMEHLVKKKDMRDYWTWLNWYSAWQMYYLQTAQGTQVHGLVQQQQASSDQVTTHNQHESHRGPIPSEKISRKREEAPVPSDDGGDTDSSSQSATELKEKMSILPPEHLNANWWLDISGSNPRPYHPEYY
jgi:hypothetical protein